jgi:hypothetical protein
MDEAGPLLGRGPCSACGPPQRAGEEQTAKTGGRSAPCPAAAQVYAPARVLGPSMACIRETACASMACLSASLTPQWGVMSPTMDSATSCTRDILMHLVQERRWAANNRGGRPGGGRRAEAQCLGREPVGRLHAAAQRWRGRAVQHMHCCDAVGEKAKGMKESLPHGIAPASAGSGVSCHSGSCCLCGAVGTTVELPTHRTESMPAPSPRMSDIMPIRYMWSAMVRSKEGGVAGAWRLQGGVQ